MRRNMSKVISVVLTMSLALSMCACSAKSSVDTENTTAEAETEIETETDEETEEETVDASGNDVSDNDVSENDAEDTTEEETLTESEEEESTEEETEDSPESKTNAASEEDEEEEIEEESTNSKTSEKDSTKSETTTSETTTEAVTVQSVSAVVSGTHYVGETLTGADIEVTVKMSDGETLTNPDGWSAQPLTLNSTSNLITVAYEGASVTITVNAETVPETTTAATVAATTQAATTTAQIVAEATTQATTAAETTQAETTTESDIEWVEWADGDYNYALAQALFIAQNEMRAEAGVDPLTWDDQMYEVAKQCAKVCGDNGVIDHTLTGQYRLPAYRVAYTGETIECMYGENLERFGADNFKTNDISEYASTASILMKSIKNSSAHYKTAIGDNQRTAIAVYKMGDSMYISYLFYGDDDEWIGESYIW